MQTLSSQGKFCGPAASASIVCKVLAEAAEVTNTFDVLPQRLPAARWSPSSGGLHVADFLLGLILSVLVGGAAFFLLRSNASWSLSRRQKANAIEVLP